MLIDNDFLGKGWGFPLGPGLTGSLKWSGGADDIRQSIEIILGTAPGERVMRPTFGCRLHELVLGANSISNRGLAQQYVQEALTMWEPRIEVQQVEVTANPNLRNGMLVSVGYMVRETNRSDNVVYPFYLK